MLNTKRAWIAAVLALSAGTVLAQSQASRAAAQREEVRQHQEAEKAANNIFKAFFPDLVTARKAAITFHNELMEAHYELGYLVMELTAQDRARLATFGFRFEPATEFMQQRRDMINQLQGLTAKHEAQAAKSTGATSDAAVAAAAPTVYTIPGYSCYETVEETFTQAQAFATSKPNLASWLDVGNSWAKTQGLGGYDIHVLKLTNSAITGTKPKLFVNAAIHAREYTTAPVVLEFARWLVNGYGVNADATWILDHHEIHLMLQTNPDGRKKAEAGLSWRKNTNTAYCSPTSNNRGADLNRNFTQSWNSTGGAGSSGNQCDLTYRGPSAASEPETQAVEAYVRTLWPDQRGPGLTDPAPSTTSGMHIDMHSYSQLVLWPWGTTSAPAPNGTALQTLGRKLAFFNSYTPQQSIGLYPTDGTSDAVSYGELGVPAFTIEMGTAFFQSCNSYNSTIKPRNLAALKYAAKVVRTPYITPSGPDVSVLSLNNNTVSAVVTQGTPVTFKATATDLRFNQTNGTEPTQNVTSIEYAWDIPFWAPGATVVAAPAADGAYNSTTESVNLSLATSGLSIGKHTLFVRALDASGVYGATSAIFLTVN